MADDTQPLLFGSNCYGFTQEYKECLCSVLSLEEIYLTF